MGIDKSMHDDCPIVVIDGTVYQYGKLPDEIMWTDKKRERDTWSVEHHSYAKDYRLFYSEQEMRDFIDGLPESEHPPFKPNFTPFITHDQWGNMKVIDEKAFDDEWERHQVQLKSWRHELAERKRREQEQQPKLSPYDRFTTQARADIDAVLNVHLKGPWDEWDDPEIVGQIKLILEYHLREYRKSLPVHEADEIGPDAGDDIPF